MASNAPTLLTLPPELRLIIYESLWVPLPALITSSHALPPSFLPTPTTLSLLLVCRHIYHEAHHTAYTRHTFTLTRNFESHPLLHEPRLAPHSYITSILITGYRPPSPSTALVITASPPASDPHTLEDEEYTPLSAPALFGRNYTFKQICVLVRRFKALRTIIILTDEIPRAEKWLRSRKAHVGFRLRKARLLQDERFVPTYGLDWKGGGRWKLTVAGEEGRDADLVLCAVGG